VASITSASDLKRASNSEIQKRSSSLRLPAFPKFQGLSFLQNPRIIDQSSSLVRIRPILVDHPLHHLWSGAAFDHPSAFFWIPLIGLQVFRCAKVCPSIASSSASSLLLWLGCIMQNVTCHGDEHSAAVLK
jgi:hypothetical protein